MTNCLSPIRTSHMVFIVGVGAYYELEEHDSPNRPLRLFRFNPSLLPGVISVTSPQTRLGTHCTKLTSDFAGTLPVKLPSEPTAIAC